MLGPAVVLLNLCNWNNCMLNNLVRINDFEIRIRFLKIILLPFKSRISFSNTIEVHVNQNDLSQHKKNSAKGQERKKKLEAESFTGFIKKLIFLYVIKFTQCMYMCVVIFNVTSQTKEKYLITK